MLVQSTLALFLANCHLVLGITVRLAVHLPYLNHDLPNVDGIVRALKLAQPGLNVLRNNYTFEVEYVPTNNALPDASDALFRSILRENALGIIGDFQNDYTLPQALSASHFRRYMCSGSSTSDTLSGPGYKSFYRTIASDGQQGAALASFIHAMSWGRVNLVYHPDYRSAAERFILYADHLGIDISTTQTFSVDSRSDFRSHIQALVNTGTLIHVLLASPASSVGFLKAAKTAGLVGAVNTWISLSSFESAFQAGNGTDWFSILEGMLYLSPMEDSGNAIAQELKRLWTTAYPNEALPAFAMLFRDCMFSTAQGLIRLIERHGYAQVAHEYPIDPVDFAHGFQVGASGELTLDANGDRDQSFVIRNIINGTAIQDVFRLSISRESSSNLNASHVNLVPLAPVMYPGLTSTKPKDHVAQAPLNVDWNSISGALLGAVTSLVIVVIVVSNLYLFWHRDVPQVKHLSFPFLCVICGGCIMTLASTLMSLGEPSSVAQCQLSAWAFVYGIELTVGASIVKAWRILSIFQNKTMAKIMPIRNQTLFAGLGVILLGQSIILLVFSVLSPLEPAVIAGRDWKYVACQNRDSIFRLPLIVTNTCYNGLLILGLELLAFKTRNISSSFSESKYLHLTAQTVTMSSVVITVLSVFDFGQATWSAFVTKHALILSAVTFVFMYLVGRLAVQVYWDMKDEGSDVDGAGDDWAIKSLSEEKLGTGSAGAGLALSPSRNRLRSNSNLAGATDAVLFRGKFPVLEKRFFSVTSRWVHMRVWLILSEALMTMTPTANSTEALLTTTVMLNRAVLNPSPAHAPNCLELFCDGKSWLIQCVSREEHKVWVERIGCVAKMMEPNSGTGSSQDLGSDRSLASGSGGVTPRSPMAINAAGGGDKNNRNKPISPMGISAMMVRLKTAPLLNSPMTPLMAHKEEDGGGVGALGSNGEMSSMGMTKEALAKAFNKPYDPDAV